MATTELDATIKALENGPKKVPVHAAIDNISGWETQLNAVANPGAKLIATELGKLKSLLQAPTPDDSAITALLHKLSTGTAEAAKAGDQAAAPKLQELSKLLAHGS